MYNTSMYYIRQSVKFCFSIELSFLEQSKEMPVEWGANQCRDGQLSPAFLKDMQINQI